jgi:hypothetical protein
VKYPGKVQDANEASPDALRGSVQVAMAQFMEKSQVLAKVSYTEGNVKRLRALLAIGFSYAVQDSPMPYKGFRPVGWSGY